ncbi:hypothetical protein ACHQM5_022370 [Ranunculus cassubicifolius]
MSSVGFSFAQIDVMRSKQEEKMKKMKVVEKENGSKSGVELEEPKANASLFSKMTKIHPNSPSPSKLYE